MTILHAGSATGLILMVRKCPDAFELPASLQPLDLSEVADGHQPPAMRTGAGLRTPLTSGLL